MRDSPPRLQLNGYVQSTPAEVRRWVETQRDLEVEAASESRHEVQLLVNDGAWRTFIKVRAICDEASLLSEVAAPADSDADLPTPAGS